jgi:hypothetical protein
MLVLPGCDLGQVIIFFGFNGVQPWARHFYWLSYCLYWSVALGKSLHIFHVAQPWVRHF